MSVAIQKVAEFNYNIKPEAGKFKANILRNKLFCGGESSCDRLQLSQYCNPSIAKVNTTKLQSLSPSDSLSTAVEVDKTASVKERRTVKCFGSVEKRDKIVKFAQTSLEFGNFFLQSPGVASLAKSAKTARTIFGLMNVFGGVIPGMMFNIKQFSNLAQSISTNEPVVIAEHAILKERRMYASTAEKVLGAACEFLYAIGAGTYAFAFGVLAPAGLAGEHFKGVVSPAASRMGSKFGFVMMINHLAVTPALILDGIRETMSYNNLDSSSKDYQIYRENYVEAMFKLSLNFVEKVAEIGADIVTVFGVEAPIWVKMMFHWVASVFALYRVSRET